MTRPAKPLNILIVDDEEVDREWVRISLEDAGMEARFEEASTLDAGRRAVESGRFDCAVVDLRLPDGDGLALLEDHANELPARPAIVLLTGVDDAAVGTQALRAGAEDYVVKGATEGEDLARTLRYAVERHRLKVTLKKREQQLVQAQRMEALGLLAGGIAHDFNNLLTALVGYGQLVRQGLGDRHPLKNHVNQIMTTLDRAARLCDQLLAFSRKKVLREERIDVHAAIHDLDDLLDRVLGEHIERGLDLGATRIHVRADRSQVEQLLINLATNARDAMDRNGRLRISTRDAELASTEPGGAGRPALRIRVEDTGRGMDERTLARIFDPFFTTKSEGKGTGLGLAAVQEIVDQAGGRIEVRSAPGQGATFDITLPATKEGAPPAAAPAPAAPGAPRRGRGERILLVEDSGLIRKLAVEILTHHGYTVHVAMDSDEAFAILGSGPSPDLVMTDVVLPKMSGPEMMERILRDRPELRVLYMSGYPDEEAHRLGNLRPGDSFLPKPFTPTRLLKSVAAALDAPPRPA